MCGSVLLTRKCVQSFSHVNHRQWDPVGWILMTHQLHVKGQFVDRLPPTVKMYDHLEATTRTYVLNKKNKQVYIIII